MVFRGYAITTIFILAGYFCLNFFYIRKYCPDVEGEEPQSAGPAAQEDTHLAPYGVPMSLSHSRSASKLEDNG